MVDESQLTVPAWPIPVSTDGCVPSSPMVGPV